MKIKTKIAAALAAAVCAVGLAGFSMPGQPQAAYAAEKPAYLKSVTYFGDEWPINYWGSEDENMDAHFEQIKADGFNSIILVIPWREFQPADGNVEFNQAAFDKLHKVMNCAEAHDLWVTLRIGYTWDYYGPSELPSRFAGVTKKDSADRQMWLRYSEAIYRAASSHANFHSGFITWEDFWDYVHNMKRNYTEEERIAMAKECGYTEYLKAHYSLAEVNAAYFSDADADGSAQSANANAVGAFTSFDQVGIPERTSPAAALFFEYYDQFLNEFLAETQTVFPGISMEVRADSDLVYAPEGTYYYSHRATFPCGAADYSAVMYSVSMGQKNEYDRISAAAALVSTNRTMNSLHELSGKKLYAEQLLYMDTTAEFSYNTQILDDEVDDYIRELAPVLREHTMGYGLWVYRNYVNNCVYNGQFGLGFTGWRYGSEDTVREVDGDNILALSKNGRISQKITGRLGYGETVTVEFWAEPSDGNATLKVSLGKKEKTVKVTKSGVYKVFFPWQSEYDLKIQTDRRVNMDDIRVYTYEQYGRIYDKDENEQDLADDFRVLNGQLE